jgi:hypothetical protein
MRTKLTLSNPVAALERIIDLLAWELVAVSDEEILEAAKELGMKPMMKGSAAFIGLQIPASPDFTEFFDPDILRGLALARTQQLVDVEAMPKGKVRRLKRKPSPMRDSH